MTLNGLGAGFLGADPNGVLDGTDESLAVTDLAGFGCLDDGVNGVCNPAVGQNEFDFYFRKKIDGVLAAAVDFGVTLLTAEPFDLADRHSFHTDAGERLFHVL